MQYQLSKRLVSTIEKLELFNERSYRLERKKFVKKIESQPYGASFSFTISRDKPTTITTSWSGPDEDEIDAFVFNLRLFVQDDEDISIKRIGDYYNKDLPIQQELIDEINQLSRSLREYKKGYTPITIDDRQIKRSKVLDVFLWGEFSHITTQQRLIYNRWSFSPTFHFLLEEFIKISIIYLNIIRKLRDLNRKVIGSLQASLFWAGDVSILRRQSYP